MPPPSSSSKHPSVTLTERFSVLSAQRVLGSGVLEPQDRCRLLAYVSAGIRAASGAGLGSSEGVVEVEYTPPSARRASGKNPKHNHDHDLGRYSKRTVPTGERYSYTSMGCGVRAWLASPYYRDIDMVNSHPTLTVQELTRYGIECRHLRAYVKCREAALQEVMDSCGVPRRAAKALFLSLCYGGGIAAWTREHDVLPESVPVMAAALQAELRDAMVALLRLHPSAAHALAQQERRNPDAPNPRASQFAYIMQDIERQCLEALADAIRSEEGLSIGAMIHDGLLVGRVIESQGAAKGPPDIDLACLQRWEMAVEAASGYSVRLAEKAWELDPAYVPAGSPNPSSLKHHAPLVELAQLPPSDAGDEYALTGIQAPLTPPQTASLADEDERALRAALKLPGTASCHTWRRDDLDLHEDEDDGDAITSMSMRLVAVGCPACLVSPAHIHGTSRSGASHSCIIVGHRSVTLCCYTHGKRSLIGTELAVVRRTLRALMPAERLINEVASGVNVKEPSSYERLMLQLESTARELSLRKLVSVRKVYKQVPGCPCAFVPYMSFTKFIRHVVGGDPDLRANVRRMAELETYMDKYEEAAFPWLVRDPDLLSFQNGVLVLSPSVHFVPYPEEGPTSAREEEDPDSPFAKLRGRVARHHIPLPYTGSEATPGMDSILSRQFRPVDGAEDDGRAEMLYALSGRLLYPVRCRDNWQVMPLLLGEAGTGKSTWLKVVGSMFSEDSLAEVDGNNESTFGFQDKFDKDVVFISDAPDRISRVLPQEMFQKMVSGERVQVSVKHGTAFTEVWRAPLIAASNKMFDYSDNAGQTSRRVVVFGFGRPIDAANADTGLEDRIKNVELPNVIAHCLGAYERMLATVGGGSFWSSSACPAVLREAQEDAMADGNLVYQFLVAGPVNSSSLRTEHFVRQIPGTITEWTALKSAFDAYVRYKHPGRSWTLSTKEVGPFLKLGYEVVQENMCCACGQRALSGCCPNYSKANRSKRWRIHGMELVCIPIVNDATSSASELRFKDALKDIGCVFQSGVRPEWLVNEVTKCTMELDLFDEGRKLAVEYDGPQHYEFPNGYHKSEAEFHAQQHRDRQKDATCAQLGVTLLRVRASDLEEELRSFKEQYERAGFSWR